MRGLPSSIPLPAPRRGRPAPPWAARRHLNPRTRSRRRAAVFGSGGTASSVRRCDGVSSRTWGRPRAGAAVQKGWERLSRPRPPGFESKRARGAALRCEGVLGELPQSSDFFSARWGSQARRDGDGHASHFAAPELFFIFPRERGRPTSPRSVPDNGPARGREGIQGPSGPAPVLGGARAVVAAPPILRRLARHQNLGPPS